MEKPSVVIGSPWLSNEQPLDPNQVRRVRYPYRTFYKFTDPTVDESIEINEKFWFKPRMVRVDFNLLGWVQTWYWSWEWNELDWQKSVSMTTGGWHATLNDIAIIWDSSWDWTMNLETIKHNCLVFQTDWDTWAMSWQLVCMIITVFE